MTVISAAVPAIVQSLVLVITDGCFSIAGIVTSWLAVQLAARNIQWYGTYLFIAAIACIILALTSLSKFPDHQAEGRFQEGPARESWPIGTWICLFALFIYTLSQYSLFLWLPNHAETRLGATIGTSIAPWVSSRIVKANDNHVVLIAASAGYFVVLALVTLAIKLRRATCR